MYHSILQNVCVIFFVVSFITTLILCFRNCLMIPTCSSSVLVQFSTGQYAIITEDFCLVFDVVKSSSAITHFLAEV